MSRAPNESAIKAMPKKPLNSYFLFRTEKLHEYRNDDDRADKVKKEWEGLSEAVKGKMD